MISRSRDFKTAGGLHGDAREPVSADSDTRGDTEKHEGPPGSVGVGQELAQVDPVERALADALTLAAQAGRFDTVEVLSRELAAPTDQDSACSGVAGDGAREAPKSALFVGRETIRLLLANTT